MAKINVELPGTIIENGESYVPILSKDKKTVVGARYKRTIISEEMYGESVMVPVEGVSGLKVNPEAMLPWDGTIPSSSEVRQPTFGQVIKSAAREYVYNEADRFLALHRPFIEIKDGYLLLNYTNAPGYVPVRSPERIRDWSVGSWMYPNIKDDLCQFMIDARIKDGSKVELRLTREQATKMAKSQEVLDYISRAPYALARTIALSNVDRCGLPDTLYGFPLVVEASQQYGPAPSKSWCGLDPALGKGEGSWGTSVINIPKGNWMPMMKNDWKPFPKPPSTWPTRSNGEPLLIKDVAVLMMLPMSEVEALRKDATWYTAWQEAVMLYETRKTNPILVDINALRAAPFPLTNPIPMKPDPEVMKAIDKQVEKAILGTRPPEPADFNRAAAMIDEANYPSISAGGPPLRELVPPASKETLPPPEWFTTAEMKSAQKAEKACPMPPESPFERVPGFTRLIIDSGTRYSFPYTLPYEEATLATVKEFMAGHPDRDIAFTFRDLKLDMTTTKVQVERKLDNGSWEVKVL
jgi:hypothetical protein